MSQKYFVQFAIAVVIAVLSSLVSYWHGITCYSSITVGAIVLLILSFFVEINKKTILPFAIILLFLFIWLISYTTYMCLIDRRCPGK